MSRPKSKTAFTLIEVLVVVAIIALLVSILLPSLARAREQSRMAICKANMKQILTAQMLYVAEARKLPATQYVFYYWNVPYTRDMNLKHTNWMWEGATGYTSRKEPHFLEDVPQRGTIFRYTRDAKLYVCPSDHEGEPTDTPMGGGGNGRLSYAMNAYVGFKSPDHMSRPAQSFKIYKSRTDPSPKIVNTRMTWSPARMPLLVEEHPYTNINRNWEGNFNVVDQIVARHAAFAGGEMARSNIGYIDTHVESPNYKIRTTAFDLYAEIGFPTYDQDFLQIFMARLK